MADRKILGRSPLAELATPGARGAPIPNPGVCIRQIVEFAAISVIARRGRITEVADVLSRHVGRPVADAARRSAAGTLSITGTAPGQWLATSRGSSATVRLEALSADLGGLAAVSDQGDGRVILEVYGRHARDALAKGVPVDLDAVAFKIGDAAQTSASHIGLQIALTDDAPTFEIISARSTAQSLWSWLIASAAEYGIDVL